MELLEAPYSLVRSGAQSSLRKDTIRLIDVQLRDVLLNYPFEDTAGDTMRIKEIKSKYILIEFWFSSCLPCLRSLPELDKMSDLYDDQDLIVIGINCLDFNNRIQVEQKLRTSGISFPLFFGARECLEQLGVTSFPSYFVLGPEKEILEFEGIPELKAFISAKLD